VAEPALPPEAPDGLITLHEAAERLGVHYMTVYRYVRTGRLPGRKIGVQWRVDPADLDQAPPSVALSDLSSGIDGTGVVPSRRWRADYSRRLVDRLVAADERGSWSIVQSALTAGHDPSDLYLDVLAPALSIIGDEWAAGNISVAQEHQASVVVHRLIGRLGPLFTRRGRTRGSVVLGAPTGDSHSLPSALFADLLRGVRFSAIDLGADTPTRSFVDTATRAERLVAVGIGATTPGNDDVLADLVAALHDAVTVPVVLGGGAIASLDQVRELGGDLWATTTRDAVALFTELADDASRNRRRANRRETP
jgi:MerR family transcriptional regulator, light-induced transcriptional regulator